MSRLAVILLLAAVAANAGITSLGTAGNTAGNGANVTVSFSGMSLEADCIVLVVGGHNTRAGSHIGPTSGYTAIVADSGGNISDGVWYKRMGATPDAEVVCYGSGNSQDAAAYVAIGLSGVAEVVLDTLATAAGEYSGEPDCPAIVTVTDSAWVIAAAGLQSADAAPGEIAGYTNHVCAALTETYRTAAALATKMVASPGSEDPGLWSAWGSQNTECFTVAIRPAASGAGPTVAPGFFFR